MSSKTNRRNFIMGGMAAATAIGCSAVNRKPQKSIASSQNTRSMPERILGKTNIRAVQVLVRTFKIGTSLKS